MGVGGDGGGLDNSRLVPFPFPGITGIIFIITRTFLSPKHSIFVSVRSSYKLHYTLYTTKNTENTTGITLYWMYLYCYLL